MPDIEQIYAEYRNKIMGYIRARIRSNADAEDLCSDVFEKIQRKLGEFDSEKASLNTWIFTITRNTVIDHFRRSRPSEELDENISDDTELDEGILNNETLGELAAALKALPEKYRLPLILHHLHGWPVGDVARMLGIPKALAVSRLHQARKALRGLLDAGDER